MTACELLISSVSVSGELLRTLVLLFGLKLWWLAAITSPETYKARKLATVETPGDPGVPRTAATREILSIS